MLLPTCQGGQVGVFQSAYEKASYGFACQKASQKNVKAQVSQAAQGESS